MRRPGLANRLRNRRPSAGRLVWLGAAAAVVAAQALVVGGGSAQAASFTQVTGFGNNPSNLRMFLYTPTQVAARPGLLVLSHFCTGSAQAVYNGDGREFVSAAERYGFIIIFPEVTRSGLCFDSASPAALRRDGGSDSTGIMSMVSYVRQRYEVDPNKIVAAGFSSGAMMTNVLAGQYPDVFKAGAAFAGVPATCFSTGSSSNLWNDDCAKGRVVKTAQQWADAVRGMYPGYTGSYPRMQIWHGGADTTIYYQNYTESIKMWTQLHGLGQTPASTDSPASGWTRTRYGNTSTRPPVEGMSNASAGHGLPLSGRIGQAVTFLGLDDTSVPPTSPTPTTTTTTRPPTTTTTRPPQSGVVLSSTFEDGTQGWTGRGGAQVAVATGTAHGGSAALAVTGRTQTWNGPIRDVTSVLVAGRTYNVGAWVRLQAGQAATTVNLTIERVSGGTTSYDHVSAETAVTADGWTFVTGSYTVPEGATSAQLYAESASATASFLLDDVVISTESLTTTTPPPTTSPTPTTTTKTTKTTRTKTTKPKTTKPKTTKPKTTKKPVTRCKTGKNGKKTCRTRTPSAASAASVDLWPFNL